MRLLFVASQCHPDTPPVRGRRQSERRPHSVRPERSRRTVPGKNQWLLDQWPAFPSHQRLFLCPRPPLDAPFTRQSFLSGGEFLRENQGHRTVSAICGRVSDEIWRGLVYEVAASAGTRIRSLGLRLAQFVCNFESFARHHEDVCLPCLCLPLKETLTDQFI